MGSAVYKEKTSKLSIHAQALRFYEGFKDFILFE